MCNGWILQAFKVVLFNYDALGDKLLYRYIGRERKTQMSGVRRVAVLVMAISVNQDRSWKRARRLLLGHICVW
jgi:hypothetical protein